MGLSQFCSDTRSTLGLLGAAPAAVIVAGLAKDLKPAQELPAGWALVAGTEVAPGSNESLAVLDTNEVMKQAADGWASDGAKWTVTGNHLVAEPGAQHAVAAYTIQPGGAGFYRIVDSLLHRDNAKPGRVELRVFVHRAGVADDRQPEPAVYTCLDAGEAFDFDTFLGFLDAGDTIYVSVGSAGEQDGDATGVDFFVECAPAIPVTIFAGDVNNPDAVQAPGGWSVASGVSDSPAARRLAWSSDASDAIKVAGDAAQVSMKDGDTVAAFRVPQSGYYALDGATGSAASGSVEARLYVGDDAAPLRTIKLDKDTSLNADLGYIARGDVVYIAFSGDGEATFDATVVEWAPRRAPLRVRRGSDGLLNVYASDAPHTAIDIPESRWLVVPATQGDATQAIRDAIEKVKSAGGGDWCGVRLQAGATYVIASDMDKGGNVFDVKNASRIVLDGNGATLLITNPELQRQGYNLFVASDGASEIVFADLTVDATHVTFTVGRLIDVNPKSGNTQTMTVKMEPGSVDPLKEISQRGNTSAYMYDPNIPGRLGMGTWSHYPNSGDGIKATNEPGVFTHTVTRTGNSLNLGDKWLIKNKKAGVVYLTTRGDSHDITISGINGKAAGGGTLRFWATSAVNVLDCRFEPKDELWISSSADGVHGRGREGVWLEDTVIRGVCEDIMNTYGRTMVVKPDEDNADDAVTLGIYESAVRSGQRGPGRIGTDDVRQGDRLVFFSPKTGKVLGYAQVESIGDGDRMKLSAPVEGVVPWTGDNQRELTMVYSINSVGNFVVRDTRFMDSMRIGIYIKARGGVVWGNTIEGQSAPGVFAVNEPEWPEGPPATHLWVEGNTFSQNNYGYMSRKRDFIVVDPADITIYTRRFRNPAEPDDYLAFVTRGQHANSHMRLVGNVFHDWRGMGIAMRNVRNATVEDNVFLPPVNDPVMRETLAQDPALSGGGRGGYAAIFMDTVGGAQISGNRFLGFPSSDQNIVTDQGVTDVVGSSNLSADISEAEVYLPFVEWFGDTCAESPRSGAAADRLDVGGAAHAAGRLGAALFFDGKGKPAVLASSKDITGRPFAALTLSLWVQPQGDAKATQVVYQQGDAKRGVVVAIDRGRYVAGLWQDDKGAWLDLGPAVDGLWQQVTLVFDGKAGALSGYVDGALIASVSDNLPDALDAMSGGAAFGGAIGATRIAPDRTLNSGSSLFRGGVDEFRLFARAVSADELVWLSMRPAGVE